MDVYQYGLAGIVLVLTIKELFKLIKWVLLKKNGGNNPHVTIATYNRDMGNLTGDIKDLEGKVEQIRIDVGVLMSRDSNMRSRKDD